MNFDSFWVRLGVVLGGVWGFKEFAFFVLIFVSFWDRLGVVWGVVLGAKIDAKGRHRLTLGGLDFDLVV